MNRDGLIARLRMLKGNAVRRGAKPIAIAMSAIDALKLHGTHVHGMEIAKHPGLKHGQVILFEVDPEAEGQLKPISSSGGSR